MAITTNQKKRVPIPHEEGEWIEIRRLGWKALADNADAATDATLRRMKEMGADLLAGLRGGVAQQGQDVPKAIAEAFDDPLKDYDQGLLLREGIVSWSYDAEVTPDNVDALDERTARWCAEEIVAYTTGRRTEEEQGEGSSPST